MSCPKCGYPTMSGPTYFEGKCSEDGRDYLSYRCPRCGYTEKRSTIEQQKAEELRQKFLKDKLK